MNLTKYNVLKLLIRNYSKSAKKSKDELAKIIKKMEEQFSKLEKSDSKSLLKKHLTREIFEGIKTKQTSFGSTLMDCIQSGLANHDSGVGIYSPDSDAYTVFEDIFNPIIEDYHQGFKPEDKHPDYDWGNIGEFVDLDPENKYVVSTRVRCGRSVEDFPFNPCMTQENYEDLEQLVCGVLTSLDGDHKGKYYALTGMDKGLQKKLIDDHFLFKEGDRFLKAANASRFWPAGRGIFLNEEKSFLCWCNEEDHIRIISMQKGGDLPTVIQRLVCGVKKIEKCIRFNHDCRLGFLTFCPSNLGTTVRASVHIKLPKLAANKSDLEKVAQEYSLQVRGTRGEHSDAEGGVYDISNKRRLGISEFCALKEMEKGISMLILKEKELEKKNKC